jgi:hypothetical protein
MSERKASLSEKLKEIPTVHIGTNIEIDRLEMEDLDERELNNLCEFYYQNLLEEVIQSDFEKPSIPEVILAVITDLTNEDNEGVDVIEFENNTQNSIYYFNQDTNTNNDIEYYYTRIHQAAPNVNDHDTELSTNSSDQSITLVPIIDQTSNELQVKFLY